VPRSPAAPPDLVTKDGTPEAENSNLSNLVYSAGSQQNGVGKGCQHLQLVRPIKRRRKTTQQ